MSEVKGAKNSDRVLKLREAMGIHNYGCCHLANSPLVGQIVYSTGGSTRMTTTKQYDDLNRLTQISSLPGASGLLPLAYNYTYNAANQRTRNTFTAVQNR